VKFPVGEVARSCAAADPGSRLVMRAQAIGAAAVCRTNSRRFGMVILFPFRPLSFLLHWR
jgi:hypothetical protein